MTTNTHFFQDPNQLIRASALRVLSSIRVPMIAPIMLLAIRESVRDMSAYVRKVRKVSASPLRPREAFVSEKIISSRSVYVISLTRRNVLGGSTCDTKIIFFGREFASRTN